MSNRVEELESKVAELQATVDGLTEELVETKERVRQLEEATETSVRRPGRPEAADSYDEGDKPEEAQESDDGAESELESEDGDIIVA